jgi:hypothetical protein
VTTNLNLVPMSERVELYLLPLAHVYVILINLLNRRASRCCSMSLLSSVGRLEVRYLQTFHVPTTLIFLSWLFNDALSRLNSVGNTIIIEFGANVGLIIGRRKGSVRENVAQTPIVRHKSHVICYGIVHSYVTPYAL